MAGGAPDVAAGSAAAGDAPGVAPEQAATVTAMTMAGIDTTLVRRMC
jgi:hypothetical protein